MYGSRGYGRSVNLKAKYCPLAYTETELCMEEHGFCFLLGRIMIIRNRYACMENVFRTKELSGYVLECVQSELA